MRKLLFVASAAAFLLLTNSASAAVSYSQQVTLAPGWNVVSTPRLLESHSFSAPETLANFAIYTLAPTSMSGWATMAELGQSEFTPLYGYFINNKGTTTQTLTFNYKASTTPNERLFERKFTQEGWYAFGVANPSYAKAQGGNTLDTDNPDHMLNSLHGATSNYSSVIDFTDASYATNADAVALVDPWKFVARSSDVTNTTEINSLNDFRETKGYAVYIKGSSTLNGFQNNDIPQSGAITVGKYSAYANQTVTVPQTALKIGEYRLVTTAEDGFTLSALGLGFSLSSTTVDKISNIYLVIGNATSNVYATATDTLIWSTNTFVPPNSTLSIAAYATLASSMGAGDTITTDFAVGGISQNTGNVVFSNDAEGQTITIAAGSLSAAVDASTPVSSLVTAYTMPKVASFKFTAHNDAFTIDELAAKVATTNDAAAISELVFKDGATELKRVSFMGTYATATGLSISIPMNTSKVIDVYANLGGIGTGYANTGANVGVTLSGYEAMNSNGVKNRNYVNLLGNNMYAYKTKPTITNVALPTTVLTTGTQTLYKFTLTADAGGVVAWRKITLNVASSSPSASFTIDSYRIYDAANESTALANVSATVAGNAVTFVSTLDQEVSGSKTYVVKATIGGTVVSGSTVSTSVASSGLGFAASTDTAMVGGTTASFVWSDESSSPHDETTPDWNNDYLVKNLPTDSLTLTK